MDARKPSIVAVVLLFLLVGAPFTADLKHRYISQALQGNIAEIADELIGLDTAELTDEERELVESFADRFGPDGTLAPAETQWPFVNDIVETYREYWKDVLFHEYSEEELEAKIVSRVTAVLSAHGVEWADSIGALAAVAGEFEKRGVKALTGRTLPHFDLLAWASHTPVDYQVELSEKSVAVRVYFMSDFVSHGWSHYATFGAAYPGGWADDTALYCMSDDYDRTSEKFKVSYLQHEGRHFADYQLFPQLQQADLEYRAKLTELIFADTTLVDLLEKFSRNAARKSSSPHALASDELIRRLSAAFFDEERVTESERWRTVEAERIHRAATHLLEESTRELTAAGADTVRGLISP
ncbi:MAG TPA: hypothetical protein VLB27_00415 [candidate division Zixibacteria bacterium]|nr:hypothetical protein [candidate division Zixibacteria bacterium]